MCLYACVLRHKLSCCNVLSVWLLIKAEICGLVSLSLPTSPDICFDFFCCCSAPSTIHWLFFSFSEPPLFGCLPVWQLQSTVDTHLSKRTELGHAWGRGVARGGGGKGRGLSGKCCNMYTTRRTLSTVLPTSSATATATEATYLSNAKRQPEIY